jgi:hypothetical protein
MSAFSSDLEDKVMNHILGGSDYSRLATVYLALFTAAPTETGGGTEVTGSGYTRLAITNNATNFPASSGGQKSNGIAFTFTPASGGSWGTVSHWAIMSASSGGLILFFGALNATKLINDTDTLSFAIGQLNITLD